MPNNSILIFNNYEVNKLIFIKNSNIEDGRKFELIPVFDKEIEKIDKDNYDVKLSFSLKPSDKSELPINIEVCMTGHFKFDNERDEDISEDLKNGLLNKNAIAILFPFLRAIISSLTASANIPPLVLPIINLAEELN